MMEQMIFDFYSKEQIPITTLQREWVELVAHEAIDNLDVADIMGLIEGMEEYYGKFDKSTA